MSNRIKIGDVYLDLPRGAATRQSAIRAEQPEPDVASVVAFTSPEPDLVAEYITQSASGKAHVANKGAPERDFDQMTAWAAFTGAKSKKPQRWKLFSERKRRHCGFNTWALLWGFQWFLFNRMIGKALLVLAVEALCIVPMSLFSEKLIQHPSRMDLGLVTSWLAFSIAVLLPRLLAGFWSDIALFHRAEREIKKIRTFPVDNKRKLAMITEAGSGSAISLLILYMLILVCRLIAGN